MQDVTIYPDDTIDTPLITVTHSVNVSAYHRLYSPHLSESENEALYGDAKFTHKHDFVFKVQFRGPICQRSGRVPSSSILQDSVRLALHELIDGKNLDEEFPFFRGRPSTIENLVVFAWRNMAVIMKAHPHELIKVSVAMNPCGPIPNEGEPAVEAEYSGEQVRIPMTMM